MCSTNCPTNRCSSIPPVDMPRPYGAVQSLRRLGRLPLLTPVAGPGLAVVTGSYAASYTRRNSTGWGSWSPSMRIVTYSR